MRCATLAAPHGRATGLSGMRGYASKKDPLSMLFLSRVREANRQVLRYDRSVFILKHWKYIH
jgi:hypothetical protein